MTRFGPFEFDPTRHQLRRDGANVHLGPKAFALLSLLLEAAPRVVSKAELHSRLWPRGAVSDATLVGLVKELRRALDDRNRQQRFIRTIHRVGYALEVPLERVQAPRGSMTAHWLVAADRRLRLASGENVVGRATESDICVDHSTVSRRHALIVVVGAEARIEDLASKNGTSVGGIELTRPTRLRDGDRVAFGHIPFVYRFESAPSTVTQLSRVSSPSSPV